AEMTIRVMEDFGVTVGRSGPDGYRIRGGQRYEGRKYRVEGDLSSASYFFAAAALCRGRIRVRNVDPGSAQGDLGLLSILERMGCHVNKGEDWIEVARAGPLGTQDMVLELGDMPDVVPTLCVIAAVRQGRTVIKGVGHLRVKESNRLAALVTELRKTGVRAEETEDGLVVWGGHPHGAQIETYNDHRMAMSFAILGLAVPGMRIMGAGCVAKSFPNFWREMGRLSTTP
ncbi:MAG: 3-phosphoshikimate 1-carboxyvinyltransferase, partial [Thermodesulfobacteriota bacterium]